MDDTFSMFHCHPTHNCRGKKIQTWCCLFIIWHSAPFQTTTYKRLELTNLIVFEHLLWDVWHDLEHWPRDIEVCTLHTRWPSYLSCCSRNCYSTGLYLAYFCVYEEEEQMIVTIKTHIPYTHSEISVGSRTGGILWGAVHAMNLGTSSPGINTCIVYSCNLITTSA